MFDQPAVGRCPTGLFLEFPTFYKWNSMSLEIEIMGVKRFCEYSNSYLDVWCCCPPINIPYIQSTPLSLLNPPRNACQRVKKNTWDGKVPFEQNSHIIAGIASPEICSFSVEINKFPLFGDKNKKWSSQSFDEIWNPLDYSEVATPADRSKLNLVPSPWGKDFDEFPTILNLHPARMASN